MTFFDWLTQDIIFPAYFLIIGFFLIVIFIYLLIREKSKKKSACDNCDNCDDKKTATSISTNTSARKRKI